MKKVLCGMVYSVLILGSLVVWNLQAQATAKKAAIKGATATTISIGTSFNPKTKVTATDAKGKNITKNLKITGSANTNKKGTYYYTYKVKLSTKQTLTVKRKITVKAKSYILKNKTRQFDYKNGFGRHSLLSKGKKISFVEKSSASWYKTSTGYWVKDGFSGDYIYIAPKEKLYSTSTATSTKKYATAGIAKVVSTTKSRVKLSTGWINKPQFVDNYATKGIVAQQTEILKIVNKERAKVGAKALVLDATLSKLAIIRSTDMVSQHYFAHESPSYGSFMNLVQQINYNYWMLGENIAAGANSGEQYMTMWMNSQGHRNNILNSTYTKIGIGVVKNTSTGFYSSVATQIFARN